MPASRTAASPSGPSESRVADHEVGAPGRPRAPSSLRRRPPRPGRARVPPGHAASRAARGGHVAVADEDRVQVGAVAHGIETPPDGRDGGVAWTPFAGMTRIRFRGSAGGPRTLSAAAALPCPTLHVAAGLRPAPSESTPARRGADRPRSPRRAPSRRLPRLEGRRRRRARSRCRRRGRRPRAPSACRRARRRRTRCRPRRVPGRARGRPQERRRVRLRLGQVVAVDADRQEALQPVPAQLGAHVVAVAGRHEGQGIAGGVEPLAAPRPRRAAGPPRRGPGRPPTSGGPASSMMLLRQAHRAVEGPPVGRPEPAVVGPRQAQPEARDHLLGGRRT